MVQIKDVPTQAYIDARLLKCLNCSCHGHLLEDCPGKFCERCVQVEHQCTCHVARTLDNTCILGLSKISCRICRRKDHHWTHCPGLLRCDSCGFFGHSAHGSRPHWPRYQWQPISASTPIGLPSRSDKKFLINSQKQNRKNLNPPEGNRRMVWQVKKP